MRYDFHTDETENSSEELEQLVQQNQSLQQKLSKIYVSSFLNLPFVFFF
jgi:hypothetical protein